MYRAKDARLGREVAIKALPEAVAQDRERLARFERKARVLASLNHPNIAQIYGAEDRALVMEPVEGEHEKGIARRHLKPANIMIAPAAVVALGLSALLASLVPAIRASLISPLDALRAE